MTEKQSPQGSAEHLLPQRQVILIRSALAGAAAALPLPGFSEMLSAALVRGLIYHVVRQRYVDIDEEAVEALLTPAEKANSLNVFSALGGLASLLRRRKRMRRLFAGLAVLHALEEGIRAFHTATLLDHYCARYHTGTGIYLEEAQKLRQNIDHATHGAQKRLTRELLEELLTQSLRLYQAVPSWVLAQLTRREALPPLSALAALVQEAQNCLGVLSFRRYLGYVIENFDAKWGEAKTSP